MTTMPSDTQDDRPPPGSSILAFLTEQRVLDVARDSDGHGETLWRFRERCDDYFVAYLSRAEVEQLALELLALVGSEKAPITILNMLGEVKSIALVPADRAQP
jgi:hypothetical protein